MPFTHPNARVLKNAGRFAPRRTVCQTVRAVCIGISRRVDERRGSLARVAVAAVLATASIWPGTAVANVRSGDRIDGSTPKKLRVPRSALPDVTMKAGVLVTEDGRVLWSRKADTRRAMASTTKIMTAIVALENTNLDDNVVVPASVRTVGYTSGSFTPGERMRVRELLEALLVQSGNDAAVSIAEHVSSDERRFVALMNSKAGELGLSDTHFANAHGLDEEGHYSSAADLAVLARYAMRDSEFRRIVGERSAVVEHAGRTHRVDNTNLLLSSYDGANGVKTGFTDDAGYCLVASASRNGTELYAVVLGAQGEQQRVSNAKDLLDWGFAHYRVQRLASAGTVVGEAVVADYLDVTVPGAVSRETTVAVFDLTGSIKRSVSMARVEAPVAKGDRIGVATFTQRGRVIATVPLLATADVEAPNVFERMGIALTRLWRRIAQPGRAAARPAPAAFAG